MGVATAVRCAVAVARLREVEATSVGDAAGPEGEEALLPPEGEGTDAAGPLLAAARVADRRVEVVDDRSDLVRVRLGVGAEGVAVSHLLRPSARVACASPRGVRRVANRLPQVARAVVPTLFRVHRDYLFHQV